LDGGKALIGIGVRSRNAKTERRQIANEAGGGSFDQYGLRWVGGN
jgi:hypothetical protein